MTVNSRQNKGKMRQTSRERERTFTELGGGGLFTKERETIAEMGISGK